MVDKSLVQGMNFTERLLLNAALLKERKEICKRVEEILQLKIVGIPEDPFLAGDIPELEYDICLVENGNKEAKVRIFCFLESGL